MSRGFFPTVHASAARLQYLPLLESRASRILLLLSAALMMPVFATTANKPTLSQQLLQAWFDTAGVCTTSSVEDIRDDGNMVTIDISIETHTRKALNGMSDAHRNDWFSLHCPPEIHGVWHQPQPPADILVAGKISADQNHTLSCVTYQETSWARREDTMRNKLQRWLENVLPK